MGSHPIIILAEDTVLWKYCAKTYTEYSIMQQNSIPTLLNIKGTLEKYYTAEFKQTKFSIASANYKAVSNTLKPQRKANNVFKVLFFFKSVTPRVNFSFFSGI